MAGLAATLNVPEAVNPLGQALAIRGPDGAVCRVDGVRGARLDVIVRAVIPSIARVVGGDNEPPVSAAKQPAVVAAIAVDGVASMSELDGAYAGSGPPGLLHGRTAYAVVLADAEREALVLARNGNAPTLYYARFKSGWLVASEPAALRTAGVPTKPDHEVLARFIATGVADDTNATFLAGIHQVRRDEVVILERDGTVRSHRPDDEARQPSVNSALDEAASQGRTAVLLRPGPLGAAVLGSALARPDRPHPLPVHTATFADLEPAASHTPAVLVPMPHGTVRHIQHTFTVADLDLDTFLRDLGEPVADLDLYAVWAIARGLGGGVDVLIDSSRGQPDSVTRVNDRITARYGVSIRCPLREAAGAAEEADLAALLSRTLPPAVVRYATRDSARPADPDQIVLELRDQVAAAIAIPRPWADSASLMDSLRRLTLGEPVDPEPLLRTYVVERWLGTLDLTEPGPRAEPPAPSPETAEPEPVAVGDVAPESSSWARWPVRTKVITPGTELPATIAWYAESAIAELRRQRAYRQALAGPWFAVVSGKVLAVDQGQVSPLWKVEPGWAARTLARLAGRRLPLLAEAWTMQVAIDQVGPTRMARAVLAAWLHRWTWLEQLLPDGAPVFAPRPEAVPPADSAVVRAPLAPDAAAETLVSALRYALPSEVFATLAGCAYVRADETGSRVMGFADGPNAEAVPRADELVARACADNPAGQGRERTPLLLVFEAPAVPQRDRAGRDPRQLDIKLDRPSRTSTRTGSS